MGYISLPFSSQKATQHWRVAIVLLYKTNDKGDA